jgi:hypothetical protein
MVGQVQRKCIPHLLENLDVVRNPKTKFRLPSNNRIFNSKSLIGDSTLQHIYKAHKASLAKELQ